MKNRRPVVVNRAAMPSAEEFDRETIKRATMFVTFVALGPFDRRRQEFLIDNRSPEHAYRSALGQANELQASLNESGCARKVLIYAVDSAGRQALVTQRDALALGLL